MEKNKGKVSFGIVCILLIIVLCLGGYIIYDKVLSLPNNVEEKNKDDNKDNSENDDKVKEEELNLNDYTVTKLYAYVNGSERFISEYFHSNLELTNKTVSNEKKLGVAYYANGFNNYKFSRVESLNSGVSQTIYTISADTIMNQINEIFGKDNGYSHDNVMTYAATIECASLKYNQGKNVYELNVAPGCGDITNYALYTKLIKAVKTSDSIILTEKCYVLSGKVVTKALIGNSPVITSDATAPSDEYFDSGATVTFTFKLSENGTYYFDNSKITY